MISSHADDRSPGDRVVGFPSGGGPTVLRILLGSQLRRLRIANGITREEAGEAIRGSHAKISRLELGRVGFKARDVADLLTLYGVTDPVEREALLKLVDQAKAQGWWHKYGDVLPAWFEVYVGLEEAAHVIRSYEIQFVPGLLQTRDYARAVIMLGHGAASVTEIERRIALRAARQERMRRPGAPKLWAVIDEAALRRPLGGRAVLREQIDYLIEAIESPNVVLQIIPFASGGHAAAGGPFTILRFAEPELPDVVYMEQLTSALYIDKRDDAEHYMHVMEQLCLEAQPPEQSRGFLERLRDELLP
ncbi:Helix-turn-helix domain-containing protein [Sinosporangium album]|uniref:Helix-turn-helix domain-containing protein n=1 Tax=Sinosporangium album TaxID=504805 RepID=A0A1G7UZK8_9ACTN|nr:helix-turn-helix transcriptional regulator [Sinosporangium album]SDG52904.1 Helix-turn-helix domain-containing protein [Sinosporangium album]